MHAAVVLLKWTNDVNLERAPGQSPIEVPDGRIIGQDELMQHGIGSPSPWVVVDGLVVDVTDWQQHHPGGKVSQGGVKNGEEFA